MIRTIFITLLFGLAPFFSTQADTINQRGKMLYENHCIKCHDSTVHIREKKKVTHRAELYAQINRWKSHLNLDWTQEEISEVAQYLEATYYSFE